MRGVSCQGMVKAPLACIVVLNYNGRDHLGYCLPSVLQTDYPNYHVIVVDNASTDGSLEMVRTICPTATLITSETNRGWSGGNNLGIQAALQMGVEYIVLANNDIRVDARWLTVAAQVAEEDLRVGVIGFEVLEPQPGSSDRDAGFELAKARWKEVRFSSPVYVGGMAMFLRAQMVERIGLIDERFFAYGEENDLQVRARKAGYRVLAVNVPVWHHGQGTFGEIPLRAAILQTRNNIQLLIKHHSVAQVLESGARHIRARVLRREALRGDSPVERRLRHSNILVRLCISAYALIWNLLHLGSILWRRREDNRRADIARQLLEREWS